MSKMIVQIFLYKLSALFELSEYSLTEQLYSWYSKYNVMNEVKKMMMKQADVNMVRRAVTSHLGRKVKIRANRGRHKIDVTEGVLEEAYPSIFLIKVGSELEDSVKMLSFSYTDVLTKDVQLTLCGN